MDVDAWGIAIEPRDYYKAMVDGNIANWHEQKFKADADVPGIVLKLH